MLLSGLISYRHTISGDSTNLRVDSLGLRQELLLLLLLLLLHNVTKRAPSSPAGSSSTAVDCLSILQLGFRGDGSCTSAGAASCTAGVRCRPDTIAWCAADAEVRGSSAASKAQQDAAAARSVCAACCCHPGTLAVL